MRDFITLAYIHELRAELELLNMVDESGAPLLNILKTPVNHFDGVTMTLVRCSDSKEEKLITSLSSIEILGECIGSRYVFFDGMKDRYDKLRGLGEYYVPEFYTDEHGNEVEVHKPEMFGVFA